MWRPHRTVRAVACGAVTRGAVTFGRYTWICRWPSLLYVVLTRWLPLSSQLEVVLTTVEHKVRIVTSGNVRWRGAQGAHCNVR